MKVKAKKTTVEYIENVDIDVCSVLDRIYHASIPRSLDHIRDDGYWYRIEDYDRYDAIYAKDRQATEDEIRFKESYLQLLRFVEQEKL